MSSTADHQRTPRADESSSRSGKALARTALVVMLALFIAACGTDDEAVEGTAAEQVESGSDASSIRVVEPEVALELVENPPDALSVIDVRTPEEFNAGHLADAVLIDIYQDDFTQQLDALDRNTPYVIYCRSGNRSEQARMIMTDLGFTDVTDIAGGFEAWQAAGYPTVE